MSWVFTFVGFAALIMLHEFGHFAAAKAVGMRVERFMLFFPPIVWKRRRGETEYGIGAIPLGGYVKITGMTPREELPEEIAYRAYHRQAVWKRIVVIAAGPVMNLIVAFALLWGIYVIHGEPTGRSTSVVEAVTANGAAAHALKPGDRLLAVDGVRGSSADLRLQIGTHTCLGKQVNGCQGTPAKVTVERNGREITLTVRPRYSTAEKRPLLGFNFGAEMKKASPGQGVSDAASGMWRITKATVSVFGKLFYSEKARKQVGSVVGGFEATREAVTSDFVNALEILAIISLSLAIVNLFPFLPLDGGHIFWALAEKIRRRPIPFSVMERASVVGFVLIITIFAIGLTNDINTLQGKGFGIR